MIKPRGDSADGTRFPRFNQHRVLPEIARHREIAETDGGILSSRLMVNILFLAHSHAGNAVVKCTRSRRTYDQSQLYKYLANGVTVNYSRSLLDITLDKQLYSLPSLARYLPW